ncbi:MAG: hypothetical protein A3F09_04620 [Chlamydiae bacterium RIFCSPHIGHO2_12_FULL_49_11]|nr:MAG: hypothetical protein A3F09_04620 [Chlamydiae bacterium RIFCSPHIGHO2_12_FULL_49_11]
MVQIERIKTFLRDRPFLFLKMITLTVALFYSGKIFHEMAFFLICDRPTHFRHVEYEVTDSGEKAAVTLRFEAGGKRKSLTLPKKFYNREVAAEAVLKMEKEGAHIMQGKFLGWQLYAIDPKIPVKYGCYLLITVIVLVYFRVLEKRLSK